MLTLTLGGMRPSEISRRQKACWEDSTVVGTFWMLKVLSVYFVFCYLPGI